MFNEGSFTTIPIDRHTATHQHVIEDILIYFDVINKFLTHFILKFKHKKSPTIVSGGFIIFNVFLYFTRYNNFMA